MEHLVIPDEQRHEAKGASTATLNQVLKSDGDGTTSFGFVNYSEVANRPTASGYRQVLQAQSTSASQAPSALNTALQVEFGVAQSNANVSLSAAGLLTFLTAGDYEVTTFLRFGRTTATGVAVIFNRVLLNGTQSLNSNSIMLDSANTIIPFSSTIKIQATAGMTCQMQIYRDSAGINNGGLTQQNPSLSGWASSPTATLVVTKFGGLSV